MGRLAGEVGGWPVSTAKAAVCLIVIIQNSMLFSNHNYLVHSNFNFRYDSCESKPQDLQKLLDFRILDHALRAPGVGWVGVWLAG